MPNHYHILLYQKSDIPVSQFLQLLFNSYSKAMNKEYQRTGTLFAGPFKSIHVDNEEYLIHLCRYIHRNPIDGNKPLVNDLSEWLYSNYPEWIEKRNGSLINREFIRSYFETPKEYRDFVLNYIPNKKLVENLQSFLLE